MLLLLSVAFILRVWDLDAKPPHFDEGINGHFVNQIWRDGFYRYDPTNFHGPLYFYILQLAEVLFGRGIFGFRFMTGLISVGVVALIAQHRRFFGSAATWAAWIVALSPAFVFYSRYAIHESLFIFLQVLFTYGYFLWKEERSTLAASFMAAGVFGSFAVKETFFIFFGTWAIAIGCVAIAERIRILRAPPALSPLEPVPVLSSSSAARAVAARPPASKQELGSVFAIAALLTAALFSGFFAHLKGLHDMIAAYAFWTKTGVGSTGHEKPFFYWTELLWRYDWPVLIGLAVAPIVFFFVGRRERIVVLSAIGLWLAYGIIPYKTPWLILNMHWLLAFVTGFAITLTFAAQKRVSRRRASLPRQGSPRVFGVAASLVAVIAIGVSVATMVRLCFRDFTNAKEPYVYVQSTMEFKHAMDWIEQRRAAHPEDLNMKIAVLSKDPWPMPWMLGHYPSLQFGRPESADLTDAAVVLIDGASRAEVERRLAGRYWVRPFQVRDAYDTGFAYFAFDRFQGIVPSASEIFSGPKADEIHPSLRQPAQAEGQE